MNAHITCRKGERVQDGLYIYHANVWARRTDRAQLIRPSIGYGIGLSRRDAIQAAKRNARERGAK